MERFCYVHLTFMNQIQFTRLFANTGLILLIGDSELIIGTQNGTLIKVSVV